MKVLIYSEGQKAFSHSGIGRARIHQIKALEEASIAVAKNKKDSFDLVHINTYGDASYRLLRRCQKKNIPVIVHGHSTIEDFKNSFTLSRFIQPFYNFYLKRMYGQAKIIVTPTPYSKKLISSYNLCNEIYDVSNGIDLEAYQYDEAKVEAFRKRFNLKKDEKFVMGVGFPFVRKGFVDFVEIARCFPDIKFFWFGKLAWIATSLPCKRAIRNKPDNLILPGYVEGDLIKGAYQSTSCTFFPSYEETEGIVVLEALASRSPLLVRNIGVYQPWLKKDVNCRMGENNEDFKKELDKLLKNKEDENVLNNAYEVAKNRSLKVVGNKLKEIYELAIEKSKIK